jgi:hypothetical protein
MNRLQQNVLDAAVVVLRGLRARLACQKRTKDGVYPCLGEEGHQGGCFFHGVMHADFDRVANDLEANSYHQRLGAKWMVEAICRDLRSRLRLNASAQALANDIERKWEDDAFWMPVK